MAIIGQRIADLAPAREFPVRKLPEEPLKRGIVVRSPNWLGDAVMTLPALHALKTLLPEGAPLAVIAPPGVAELYRFLPDATHILTLDKPHTAWPEPVRRMIRDAGFQIGVLFNNSLRDTISLRRSGVSMLFGRAARGRSFLLKRSFAFPGWRTGRLNRSHHANEYLAMVRALGAEHAPLAMPELQPYRTLDQLDLELQGFCQHPNLMVLAPGAAYGAAKRWPSANFREVARRHIEQGGIVVVVGSAGERAIGDEVLDGLPANRAGNLSGKTSLSALYHLLKIARLCVANDSGIMHFAAALGTPGVAVFGPTDYCATGPVSDRWNLVFDKEPCAPCFERVCPRGNPCCITKITPETVIEAILALPGKAPRTEYRNIPENPLQNQKE